MAAPIAVDDIFRVRSVCYTPDQISINVMYGKITAISGVVPTRAQLADEIDTRLQAAYKALMPEQARYRGIGVQQVTVPTPLEYTAVTNDGQGTAPGELLPTQVSGVISLYTDSGTKHGRGRVYPGLLSNQWAGDAGKMAVAGLDVLQALGDLLLGSITVTVAVPVGTATMTWVHRAVFVFPPAPPLAIYEAITVAKARQRFGTQRRRGQFGQTNALPF